PPTAALPDGAREGGARIFFYPTVPLALPRCGDPRSAAGSPRLYNRWLAGYCRPHGGRLRGVAVVPIEDVATSIAIMREAKALDLVATMVPAALKRRNLDHPDLEPLYAAAEELDMALCVHGAP